MVVIVAVVKVEMLSVDCRRCLRRCLEALVAIAGFWRGCDRGRDQVISVVVGVCVSEQG